MKEILINCASIGTREALHDALAREMNFPDWYGRNLDALHDMLTSLSEETNLTLLHVSALPFPSAGLLRVLQESAGQNPNLKITLVTN